MDGTVVVKVALPEESLPQGIEGEVISAYTVKSSFDGIKKTYLVVLTLEFTNKNCSINHHLL